ncbi:LysM peptidoglycan-binding domain-containing protein [Bifidobacterium sp. SO1]|nr:LysM peptidoglycan-binding domain-containing protein [Bifidobacterium sp. SO1]MBW3078279.1 LysM peptidoglycan-binding domain-containing protein [Bifidobacterium simiiventris]
MTLAWIAYSWLVPMRADSASTAMEVTCYTVQPGDTLWQYAQAITPAGGDVSSTVERLRRLNDLDSYSLQVGQRIIVPAESES